MSKRIKVKWKDPELAKHPDVIEFMKAVSKEINKPENVKKIKDKAKEAALYYSYYGRLPQDIEGLT